MLYKIYTHTFFRFESELLRAQPHCLQAEGHIISKVASPIPIDLQEHPSSKTQTLCLARATQKVSICCPTVDLCWTLTSGNGNSPPLHSHLLLAVQSVRQHFLKFLCKPSILSWPHFLTGFPTKPALPRQQLVSFSSAASCLLKINTSHIAIIARGSHSLVFPVNCINSMMVSTETWWTYALCCIFCYDILIFHTLYKK